MLTRIGGLTLTALVSTTMTLACAADDGAATKDLHPAQTVKADFSWPDDVAPALRALFPNEEVHLGRLVSDPSVYVLKTGSRPATGDVVAPSDARMSVGTLFLKAQAPATVSVTTAAAPEPFSGVLTTFEADLPLVPFGGGQTVGSVHVTGSLLAAEALPASAWAFPFARDERLLNGFLPLRLDSLCTGAAASACDLDLSLDSAGDARMSLKIKDLPKITGLTLRYTKFHAETQLGLQIAHEPGAAPTKASFSMTCDSTSNPGTTYTVQMSNRSVYAEEATWSFGDIYGYASGAEPAMHCQLQSLTLESSGPGQGASYTGAQLQALGVSPVLDATLVDTTPQ